MFIYIKKIYIYSYSMISITILTYSYYYVFFIPTKVSNKLLTNALFIIC